MNEEKAFYAPLTSLLTAAASSISAQLAKFD